MVRVDEMRHLVAHAIGSGDFVHCPLQIAADGGGCVEEHDAISCRQECGYVDTIGDPVEVPLHAANVIALVVEGRAERCCWDRCVIRQYRAGSGCIRLALIRLRALTRVATASPPPADSPAKTMSEGAVPFCRRAS